MMRSDTSLVVGVGHLDLVSVTVGEVVIEAPMPRLGLQLVAWWNR